MVQEIHFTQHIVVEWYTDQDEDEEDEEDEEQDEKIV